jgi:hypothetical protein
VGEAGAARGAGLGEERAQAWGAPQGERRFSAWQGRLPQELRLARVTTLEQANEFFRGRYIPEINRKFAAPAAGRGHAFVLVCGQDLDRIFSVQSERVVAKDNTVQWGGRVW